jgi:membrane-associated phospholipid phosphatase
MEVWWKNIHRMFTRYRHIIWLILITFSLTGFLYLLPAQLRADLLHSILTQRRLTLMLLTFGLLALSLLWSLGQRIDVWTFLYFNVHGNRPRWLDGLMLILTQGGNGITAFLVAGFYYLNGLRIMATMIIFGTLTLWLAVELIKAIIQRARPFEKLLDVRVVGGRAIGRSFPSGHTSQAFFLVTLLAQFYQLEIGAALTLYVLAAMVGITRMYVGAHYPRDVLAGAILGSVWGVLGGMLHTQLMG